MGYLKTELFSLLRKNKLQLKEGFQRKEGVREKRTRSIQEKRVKLEMMEDQIK